MVSNDLVGMVSESIKSLEELTYYALVSEGISEADAKIITDVLMFAEKRKNNQGLVKITKGHLKQSKDAGEISVVKESPVSAQLNGANRIGMAIISKAVDMAIEKASTTGIALIGASGYASATGALGYWSTKLAKEGFVSIITSQCSEMVAPNGSYDAIFGTNPIAIGIPNKKSDSKVMPDNEPIVLDMATSAAAYFGLVKAAEAKEYINDDVAYDKHGKATTSPAEALAGALRVFDRSHKGSGLALMVELLAGAMTGASMGPDKRTENNWGTLIIALDPTLLGTEEGFYSSVEEMCLRVKESSKLDGVKQIYLPGERGSLQALKTIEAGTIDVPSQVLDKLKVMAELGRAEILK